MKSKGALEDRRIARDEGAAFAGGDGLVELKAKNEEIMQQKEEIQTQRDEIERQRDSN